MKKTFLLLLWLSLQILGFAQEYGGAGDYFGSVLENLNWDGYFYSDDRFGVTSPNKKMMFQEYRLSLKPSVKTKRTAFSSEIWVRSMPGESITSYTQLSDRKKTFPTDVELREAWFEVYDIFAKGLDLRIGKQRIAWGAADRLNPTDNINPYDLEDIWDFGRHLSSNSAKLTYYKNNFYVSGVFVPAFSPSAAPDMEWMSAFMPEFSMPDEYDFNGTNYKLINKGFDDFLLMPDKTIKKSSTMGLRTGLNIGSFNLSASFAHSFDVMPSPSKAHLTDVERVQDKNILRYNLDVELKYPRMNILGFDFAGSLATVGVWGEAALFFPEKIQMAVDMSYMGLNIRVMDSTVIDNKPYLKYVLGLDYTFPHNIYANFQYLHGFFHENGTAGLNDYFVLAGDWKVFQDKLKISPFNFCIQVNDWSDLSNEHAWILLPEVTYQPAGGIELTAGARIINGTGSTMFGKLKDKDHVLLKCKISF
ncbi:MAG TPA: hypothetical protein PK908_04835 [Bacteroidales bacterium]|nr:hypothetical protein [Bacteroidales bacterium]